MIMYKECQQPAGPLMTLACSCPSASASMQPRLQSSSWLIDVTHPRRTIPQSEPICRRYLVHLFPFIVAFFCGFTSQNSCSSESAHSHTATQCARWHRHRWTRRDLPYSFLRLYSIYAVSLAAGDPTPHIRSIVHIYDRLN